MQKLIVSLLVLVWVLAPRPALACDSFLCLGDIFGLTDLGDQAVIIADRDAQKDEAINEKYQEELTERTNINAWRDTVISANQLSEAQANTIARMYIEAIKANRDVNIEAIRTEYLVWEKQSQIQPVNNGLSFWRWVFTICLVIFYLICRWLWLLSKVAQPPDQPGPITSALPYLVGGTEVRYPQEVKKWRIVDGQ